MAAGLGFKTFTTGEVLTAADTNGYLMQGVLVFASAAARDAAITSPQEGQFAYLKDTNVTTYYTGSAWTNLDTTGMVNPMTTTGDTIYSSSGSTPARLGIGSTGQVMTVAGGIPSWATPSGGASGLTFIKRGTFSSVADTGTTFDSIFTSTYDNYVAVFTKVSCSTATADLQCQLRYAGPTTQTGTYSYVYGKYLATAVTVVTGNAQSEWLLSENLDAADYGLSGQLNLYNILSTGFRSYATWTVHTGYNDLINGGGIQGTSRTYTGLLFKASTGNISGTIDIYGLAKS
jgi:hypothetical protein